MSRAVTLLAAGAVLLAGCARTAAPGPDRTLRVGLSEYRVSPQAMRASAGSLTLVVHNYGRLTHNLAVTQDGVTEAATKPVWPGQTTYLSVTLPRGRYQIASTLLSDQALGAYASLRIQ